MKNLLWENRQRISRKVLESNHLDGILFIGLENIRYLCGFTGSDGALLLTPEESFFLTDSRYWTQSEEEVRSSHILRYKKKLDGIVSTLRELKLKRVGFDSLAFPFAFYQSLQERLAGQIELVPLEKEIKSLRAIKDEQEMLLIRRAIDIASKSFEHILSIAKEGISEREIAIEMEFFMKKGGSEAMGFDIIVASGKRSAHPHGRAGLKKIERGDFVLIDFGSTFEGYHSDQTRTVICGEPSPDQKKVYEIVREAHDQAIQKIRPGLSIQEVDQAARDYIQDHGYAEYFGHGTGHGIGLAVHEEPVINKENGDPLQEGMVFTIEPGIYIPEWGGVRIEDMVRVTSQGAEVLTYLPTDLRII